MAALSDPGCEDLVVVAASYAVSLSSWLGIHGSSGSGAADE